MNLQLSRKELSILVAALFVVIAFTAGGYYFYLQPKKQEVSNKQIQLETQEKLLATLQSQAEGEGTPLAESVAELQKKVPVKKQLEQLILDLNKAEVVSNSLISSMNFSDGTISAPQAAETDEDGQPSETNDESQLEGEDTNSVAFPEGIKKLTVNLSVTSPSYRETIQFLEALEGLNRRVVIESVGFSGGSELTSVEQEKEEFSYSLALSAFYMPELGELEDQLPELEVPAPSNKTNPFATSADFSE